ncbi:hypothetical protein [Halpernia sp. GG3]
MLTVFYFGFSSGMVYDVNSCLNKISIFSGTSKKSCDFCGTKKEKDCCKHQIKILKTDVAQKADMSFVGDSLIVAILPKVYFAEFLTPVLKQNYFSVHMNAPPDKQRVALFVTNCNFRI